MTLTLDDNQLKIVDVKRKASGNRPKYYNAATRKMTEISDDFEAFLILQGSANNSNTVQWLDQCTDFAIKDLSRDSLAALALKNEIADATNSQYELTSFITQFESFRSHYNMTGFENVVEAGELLQDLMRPMQELQTLKNRLRHRVQYASLMLNVVSNEGVTPDDQKQIDSWYSPLSAY